MLKRKYAKPPITEAVLEIRYVQKIARADLQKISKRLRKPFPKIKDISELKVALHGQGKIKVAHAPTGYKLTSKDDLSIVLLQEVGIASARLAPYPGWETLRSQTEAVLKEAKKVIGHSTPQRIGVRYINRLDVPLTEIRTDEWVRLGATVPIEFGTIAQEFAVRVVVPIEDAIKANISCQTVPSPLLEHTSLTLDIDVFVDHDIPTVDANMWELIEKMRAHKNNVFENSITEKMRARFDLLEAS
jgi:uncharacterized protein (TIGR04255 family)